MLFVYLAVLNVCMQCGVCVFKTMGKVLLLTRDVIQVARSSRNSMVHVRCHSAELVPLTQQMHAGPTSIKNA
jgi:hypothetical protein